MIVPWLRSAWSALAQRRASGRMPHALLAGGPSGLGKREFVQALTRALLCSTPDAEGYACDRCRGCTLAEAGSHPDYRLITLEANEDGKLRSEIAVDQIRALGAAFASTSQFGGYRVAVIDPATAMNASSANALLKTLEEPDPGAVLILVADSPSLLAATLRSRCQRIDARFPARAEALRWLEAQGVAAGEAAAALDLAAGNPGLARRLADPATANELRKIAGELAGVLERREPAALVAQRWAQDEDRGVRRLLHLALLLRTVAWGTVIGDGVTFRDLARLTASIDLPKLAAWWERANRVREQLATPLRADLLLTELLDELAPVSNLGRGRVGI